MERLLSKQKLQELKDLRDVLELEEMLEDYEGLDENGLHNRIQTD